MDGGIEYGVITDNAQIETVLATGAAVQVSRHLMQVVGWREEPAINGGRDEQKVVFRFALPRDAAEAFFGDMAVMLGKTEPAHNQICPA